jgi:hypothetical protein
MQVNLHSVLNVLFAASVENHDKGDIRIISSSYNHKSATFSIFVQISVQDIL